MSFLRDRGYIQPTDPSETSANHGNMEKRYYLVKFDLVMILDGRDLRYEARWPPHEQLEKFGQPPNVQASRQICVAAAFRPGTAWKVDSFTLKTCSRETITLLELKQRDAELEAIIYYLLPFVFI
jgi:hypothetical protein